jgi:hypothetical protein
VSLVIAALSETPSMRIVATVVGMLTIGVGAALANPQLSGVAIAAAPPAQAGMASAVMMIVRQGGFAISIAVLGATLGTTNDVAAFAKPFALATLVALLGTTAALMLLPPKSR